MCVGRERGRGRGREREREREKERERERERDGPLILQTTGCGVNWGIFVDYKRPTCRYMYLLATHGVGLKVTITLTLMHTHPHP